MRIEWDRVHHGDCLALLGQIGTGDVDLAFADPPFNIGYKYDLYDDRRNRRDYLDWSRKWLGEIFRVLKPTGTFWLAIGDEYAAELKLIAQEDVGFACRSWVIWYYTFGVNCVRGFSRSHTHLLHFVKDRNGFTFNAENPAVRVLSARQLVYKDARANSSGRLPDNTWIFRPQDAPPSAFAPLHDTWYFSRVAGTFREREGFHGCQMPEQLLGRIIRLSSNPQDLILDPFAGSGTTLVAAKKLGRRWLGFELSDEYVRRVRQRLDAAQVGDPLDGPVDPLRSAPKTTEGRRRVRIFRNRPLPSLDEDTKRGIIAAYCGECVGNSVDHVLCDPAVDAQFVEACRKKGLPGDAFTWNRLLLRLRKSGAVPKVVVNRRRLTFPMMDQYSHASEIAMHLMGLNYACSLDDVLCSPAAAMEFDQLAAEFAPGFSPFEYRWAALAIRKRATKSKLLAKERFAEWSKRRLPRSLPLGQCMDSHDERPGVYILTRGPQPLYVGETHNLHARLERALKSPQWTRLHPESICFLPTETDSLRQHGLQSALIQRSRPLLNSQLLLPRVLDEA